MGTSLGSSDAAGAAEQSADAVMQPNGRLSHQPSLGSEAGKSTMLDVSAFTPSYRYNVLRRSKWRLLPISRAKVDSI